MNDLITNINQAASDFNNIKQAIINKGVTVPQGTHTSQYAELISSISDGGFETSGFDMTGITARFDVSGINIENKIWTNSVEGGHDLTFTDGSISDNSLMIPGGQHGQFTLENEPDFVYLVVKKPWSESDRCFFGKANYSFISGTLWNFWKNSDNFYFWLGGDNTYYVRNIDNQKYHLFAMLRYNSQKIIQCFFDGEMVSYTKDCEKGNYLGYIALNRAIYRSDNTYQCMTDGYFKFIAAGELSNTLDTANYYKIFFNNMDWLMKNIVNPANDEV